MAPTTQFPSARGDDEGVDGEGERDRDDRRQRPLGEPEPAHADGAEQPTAFCLVEDFEDAVLVIGGHTGS
jgi:hypothetical protein